MSRFFDFTRAKWHDLFSIQPLSAPAHNQILIRSGGLWYLFDFSSEKPKMIASNDARQPIEIVLQSIERIKHV